MATVFTNEETAHVWASQTQDYGRNHNETLYFRGDTIYSYGSHHVIARFYRDDVVLMNRDTYSNTTAQHHSTVRGAVRHKTVIRVPNPHVSPSMPAKMRNRLHRENLNYFFDRAKEEGRAFLRARTRKWAAQTVLSCLTDLRTYAEKCGARHLLTKDMKEAISVHQTGDVNQTVALMAGVSAETVREKYEEIEDRGEAKREKNRKAREKRRKERKLRAEKAKEKYPDWLRGEATNQEIRLYVRSLSHNLVRFKNGQFVTNSHARVNPRDAYQLLMLMLDARENSQPVSASDLPAEYTTVGRYKLTRISEDGTATVGCHTLNLNQCVECAESIGWIEDGELVPVNEAMTMLSHMEATA